MPTLKITTETFGGVMVVHAPGELTSDTAHMFVEAVAEATRNHANVVVLEFDQTERFDSVGLESIVELQERLQDAGSKLRVCGLSEIGRKIFQITRLEARLEAFDSVVDAVASSN